MESISCKTCRYDNNCDYGNKRIECQGIDWESIKGVIHEEKEPKTRQVS